MARAGKLLKMPFHVNPNRKCLADSLKRAFTKHSSYGRHAGDPKVRIFVGLEIQEEYIDSLAVRLAGAAP